VRTLDVGGVTWFTFTRRYPSAEAAKRAYEKLAAEGRRQGGKLDLGFYRHGTQGSGMVYVTVISHEPGGMKTAKRMLRGGTEVGLCDDYVHAFILRRARVIDALYTGAAPAGSYEFPRAKPEHLYPDGTTE
jgi:hypothetical protein